MNYSEELLKQINDGFESFSQDYSKIVEKLLFIEHKIKNKIAREYLMHGIKRRVDILEQCIFSIFELFPPDTEKLIGIHNITKVNVNLHAFLINIYGIIENLALFIAYELNLFDQSIPEIKQRKKVGLFRKDFQKLLPKTLQDYFLNNLEINKWYDEYAKSYRDALAHRIPPFVPPMQLNPEEAEIRKKLDKEIEKFEVNDFNYDELREKVHKSWTIGSPAKYFFHSISEKSRLVVLHGQILNDFITVKEMIYFVLDSIYP